MSIYHRGKLIDIHVRLQGDNALQSKSTKLHHRKPWEQAMQDHSAYRERAQLIGPDCDRLVLIILSQGQGFIDTRKIWGILSLDKSHSKSAINEACKQAIALDSLSYQTVKRLLKLIPHSDTHSVSQKQNSHKFVRPLSVYEEQMHLLLH